MKTLSQSDVKVALEALKVEDVPTTLGTNGEREQQWIYGFIAGQKAMKRKALAILDAQEAAHGVGDKQVEDILYHFRMSRSPRGVHYRWLQDYFRQFGKRGA